jgi:hypothetical protein
MFAVNGWAVVVSGYPPGRVSLEAIDLTSDRKVPIRFPEPFVRTLVVHE